MMFHVVPILLCLFCNTKFVTTTEIHYWTFVNSVDSLNTIQATTTTDNLLDLIDSCVHNSICIGIEKTSLVNVVKYRMVFDQLVSQVPTNTGEGTYLLNRLSSTNFRKCLPHFKIDPSLVCPCAGRSFVPSWNVQTTNVSMEWVCMKGCSEDPKCVGFHMTYQTAEKSCYFFETVNSNVATLGHQEATVQFSLLSPCGSACLHEWEANHVPQYGGNTKEIISMKTANQCLQFCSDNDFCVGVVWGLNGVCLIYDSSNKSLSGGPVIKDDFAVEILVRRRCAKRFREIQFIEHRWDNAKPTIGVSTSKAGCEIECLRKQCIRYQFTGNKCLLEENANNIANIASTVNIANIVNIANAGKAFNGEMKVYNSLLPDVLDHTFKTPSKEWQFMTQKRFKESPTKGWSSVTKISVKQCVYAGQRYEGFDFEIDSGGLTLMGFNLTTDGDLLVKSCRFYRYSDNLDVDYHGSSVLAYSKELRYFPKSLSLFRKK